MIEKTEFDKEVWQCEDHDRLFHKESVDKNELRSEETTQKLSKNKEFNYW